LLRLFALDDDMLKICIATNKQLACVVVCWSTLPLCRNLTAFEDNEQSRRQRPFQFIHVPVRLRWWWWRTNVRLHSVHRIAF